MKNIFYIKKDNDFQKIKRVFKIVKLRGNQSHLIVKLKKQKNKIIEKYCTHNYNLTIVRMWSLNT